MAEPTDFELMERIQTRERRAHVLLKDRYRKRLYDIAFAILRNSHKAEETVKQVFEFCWRQADILDLDRDRSVAVWLYELTEFYARERSHRWPWAKQGSALRSSSEASAPNAIVIGLLSLAVVSLGTYASWVTWQNRQLQAQMSTQRGQGQETLQQLREQWEEQSTTRFITLRDPEAQSPTLVQLLWSPVDRQALLSTTNLRPVEQGQTYQLWVGRSDPDLPSDLQVESAGTFLPSHTGTLNWLSPPLSLQNPDRFILTLEPEGGSERPTGEIVLHNAPILVNLGSARNVAGDGDKTN